MKTKRKNRTRTQIIADFKHHLALQGKNLTTWAEEQGYTQTQVYSVTRGLNKGTFGTGREIAEKIGLVEVQS